MVRSLMQELRLTHSLMSDAFLDEPSRSMLPYGPFPPSTSGMQVMPEQGCSDMGSITICKDLQRMFARKISFDTVAFSTASKGHVSLAVMFEHVMKLTLKTLVEEVRLTTFSRAGFQQMQVDCGMLRWVLPSYIEDKGDVLALLDEACISSQERCLDCVPLEHAVIETLCEYERQVQLMHSA